MNSDKLEALIQKRLLGTQSAEEQAEMNALLLAQPDLAEELEFRALLKDVGDELIASDLRQKLVRWRTEIRVARQRRRRKLAWASLAILAGTACFFYFKKPVAEPAAAPGASVPSEKKWAEPDTSLHASPLEKAAKKAPDPPSQPPQKPNAAPSKPPPKTSDEPAQKIAPPVAEASEGKKSLPPIASNLPISTSRNSPFAKPTALDSMLHLVDEAISSGRLDDAIGLMKTAVARFPANDDLRLPLAQLYRKNGNLDLAIATLEAVLNGKKFFLGKFESELMNCYFEGGVKYEDKLKPLLEKIVNDPPHPAHRQAVEMREKLARQAQERAAKMAGDSLASEKN